MAEHTEQPRPHGDPLRDEVQGTSEENRAQRDSDAAPDANGIPEFDEAADEVRKKQYREGAEIVSRID